MAVLPSNTNQKLHVVRFQFVRRQIYFERFFGLELFVELIAFCDQGVGVFCLRRQAGEAKHRTKHPDSAKSAIRIHQRNIAAPGHASILSDSPAVTVWAAKAGQRRSSYTVPGSGAVISQAASRYRCGHETQGVNALASK